MYPRYERHSNHRLVTVSRKKEKTKKKKHCLSGQHRRAAIGDLALEKPHLLGDRLPPRFGIFIFEYMPRMVANFVSLVSEWCLFMCCGSATVSCTFYAVPEFLYLPPPHVQQGQRKDARGVREMLYNRVLQFLTTRPEILPWDCQSWSDRSRRHRED